MKTHLTVSICVFVITYFFCVPRASNKVVANIKVNPTHEVKVEPEIKKNAIIEMQLADWCASCKRLKASGVIPELKTKGWKIEYNDKIGGSFPTIRVWVKGESRTFSGFRTEAAFYRTLNKNIRDMKQ